MNLYENLKKFGELISELAGLYGEMSDELLNPRVVVDNTRAGSDLKKTYTEKLFISQA